MDFNALGFKPCPDDRNQFPVIGAHDLHCFKNRDLRAELTMGLRQLQPDRPAADNNQMIGAFAQSEDGLIGQERHIRQTGYRRHGRR